MAEDKKQKKSLKDQKSQSTKEQKPSSGPSGKKAFSKIKSLFGARSVKKAFSKKKPAPDKKTLAQDTKKETVPDKKAEPSPKTTTTKTPDKKAEPSPKTTTTKTPDKKAEPSSKTSSAKTPDKKTESSSTKTTTPKTPDKKTEPSSKTTTPKTPDKKPEPSSKIATTSPPKEGEKALKEKTVPPDIKKEKPDKKLSSPSPVKSKKATDKTLPKREPVLLEGLFAFKMSMATFYDESGKSLPVTALKYEPAIVSQIKNPDKKESYSAIQVAFKPRKKGSKALKGHLKPADLKEGSMSFLREIRQKIPEGIKLGQELSINSLKKGDQVKISSFSKGRGFSGVMKRWNFAGGKASHGSKSHRRTGAIGQHTEPSRVFPGRRMPGQYGFKRNSRLKVPIVDVLPEEGIIFVKGPVPGARNTLVSLKKMPATSIQKEN